MTLKIYRIDRSLFGKMNHFFKKPDLPVGISSAFAGDPIKNYSDFKRENSYVLTDKDEINRFTEAYGDEWVDDTYYIRHPKKSKTDILIRASRFKSYVTRELLSDMISYIRANLKINELEISISRDKSAQVNLKSLVENIELEGEANVHFRDNYTVKILCNRALKASEKKSSFIWIDEFPHIISMIDNAEDGEFFISEEVDLSFGITAKVASEIGLDLSANSNYTFCFRVVAS